MNDSEFYKRAAADAAFRHANLEELRYIKNVCAGLMWFCVAAAIAFSVYGGITEGRWTLGYELLVVAVFTGSSYALYKTRIAALEALDTQEA